MFKTRKQETHSRLTKDHVMPESCFVKFGTRNDAEVISVSQKDKKFNAGNIKIN